MVATTKKKEAGEKEIRGYMMDEKARQDEPNQQVKEG